MFVVTNIVIQEIYGENSLRLPLSISVKPFLMSLWSRSLVLSGIENNIMIIL